jgi:hypothetical protein
LRPGYDRFAFFVNQQPTYNFPMLGKLFVCPTQLPDNARYDGKDIGVMKIRHVAHSCREVPAPHSSHESRAGLAGSYSGRPDAPILQGNLEKCNEIP